MSRLVFLAIALVVFATYESEAKKKVPSEWVDVPKSDFPRILLLVERALLDSSVANPEIGSVLWAKKKVNHHVLGADFYRVDYTLLEDQREPRCLIEIADMLVSPDTDEDYHDYPVVEKGPFCTGLKPPPVNPKHF